MKTFLGTIEDTFGYYYGQGGLIIKLSFGQNKAPGKDYRQIWQQAKWTVKKNCHRRVPLTLGRNWPGEPDSRNLPIILTERAATNYATSRSW